MNKVRYMALNQIMFLNNLMRLNKNVSFALVIPKLQWLCHVDIYACERNAPNNSEAKATKPVPFAVNL